jgi:hypothetical protein
MAIVEKGRPACASHGPQGEALEFPVVVLANTDVNATHERPSRHVEPERRLWVQPVCGCVLAELLDHAEEELR